MALWLIIIENFGLLITKRKQVKKIDEDNIIPEFIQEDVKDFSKYIIKKLLMEMINIKFNELLEVIKDSIIANNKVFENSKVKDEVLKEIYYGLQEQIQKKLLEL